MTTSAISKNSLMTYSELKRRVREALAEGTLRIQRAVEKESLRTKWEVGKLIDEHILIHKERADYGKQVLQRLAADIDKSVTEVRYMLEFYRANPIHPDPGELSWSKHRDLLSVNDPARRKQLIQEAVNRKWNDAELRREIKKIRTENPSMVTEIAVEESIIPVNGVLEAYRVVLGETGPWLGKPVVDLGFSNYQGLHAEQAGKLREGDIIDSSLQKISNATEVNLFTYRAYVIEITDGDTIWMAIDLGFGNFTRQHLRLRGIDCPEVNTAKGQEAKRFVEHELKRTSSIIITTTKSDKYDRYLVDLFYLRNAKQEFLNNKLLSAQLAIRMN